MKTLPMPISTIVMPVNERSTIFRTFFILYCMHASLFQCSANMFITLASRGFVTAVGWLTPDELISVGDDRQLLRWNLIVGEAQPIETLPDTVFPTDLRLPPRILPGVGKKAASQSESIVLTSSDGNVYFLSKSGRIEKTIDAHKGAVIHCRWSTDGSSLLTVGEDGAVKVWSRNGMLRSTVCQNSLPVYDACWSPDNSSVVYTQGGTLYVRALQGTQKERRQWKAHDAVVLAVDWSDVNGNIASGSEDGRYKIWDSYGRQLYSSSANDHPISSVAWSPDGYLLAVGSFNMLRLCDKAGWSHCLEKPVAGSLWSIQWSSDSTQLAAACASSNVIFAHVIENREEWREIEVSQVKRKTIEVSNVLNDSKELLQTKDRIVKMRLGWDHLVVATTAQCYIFSSRNWNTPNIFELAEGGVSLIVVSPSNFALVTTVGISIHSFDGKQQCSLRLPTVHCESLSASTLAISPDTVAVRDKAEPTLIHVINAATGKPLGDGRIVHKQPVSALCLSQSGGESDRRLAFTDSNQDLWLASPKSHSSRMGKPLKIGALVKQLCFNDNTPMLCGLQDSTIFIWTYPNIALTDKDLLSKALLRHELTDVGKNLELLAFVGNQVSLRRTDGSIVKVGISPFPGTLHEILSRGKWDHAMKLCRHIKDEGLWTILAVTATVQRNLSVAEVAYAAINEFERVQFLRQAKAHSKKEIRDADLWLLSGNVQNAEQALLQGGQHLRAIMVNIELHRWDRALELATKHKKHVDVVLAFRHQMVEEFGRRETNQKFIDVAKEVDYDWESIQDEVERELNS